MTSQGPSATESRKDAAVEMIRGESTLTLATAGEKGIWSAPVYYVFLDGGFFFFSSPRSRHIRQALKSGQAAASLFLRTDTWQTMQGLQMQGAVKPIRSLSLSLEIITAYLKRYPFTRDFFPKNTRPDPKAFLDRFKAKLYGFSPTEVYYMDNRYGFGNRQKIHL